MTIRGLRRSGVRSLPRRSAPSMTATWRRRRRRARGNAHPSPARRTWPPLTTRRAPPSALLRSTYTCFNQCVCVCVCVCELQVQKSVCATNARSDDNGILHKTLCKDSRLVQLSSCHCSRKSRLDGAPSEGASYVSSHDPAVAQFQGQVRHATPILQLSVLRA